MRLSLLIPFLLLSATLHAAAPGSSTSVSLDVSDTVGGSSSLDRSTYYGSVSRTAATTRQLTINVRNMSGTLPGEFEIEWYFFGKPAGGTKRFIYDIGNKKVSLAPSAFEKISVESKELNTYRYRSGYSSYVYQSGDKPEGWIVRAKVGAEVVRVKASNAQMEQIEKDTAAFEVFIKNARIQKSPRGN